jgi:hypothetical protein
MRSDTFVAFVAYVAHPLIQLERCDREQVPSTHSRIPERVCAQQNPTTESTQSWAGILDAEGRALRRKRQKRPKFSYMLLAEAILEEDTPFSRCGVRLGCAHSFHNSSAFSPATLLPISAQTRSVCITFIIVNESARMLE